MTSATAKPRAGEELDRQVEVGLRLGGGPAVREDDHGRRLRPGRDGREEEGVRGREGDVLGDADRVELEREPGPDHFDAAPGRDGDDGGEVVRSAGDAGEAVLEGHEPLDLGERGVDRVAVDVEAVEAVGAGR